MTKSEVRFVTYLRRSDPRLNETGTCLEAQRQAVETFARRHAAPIFAEYVEMESGTRSGRPQLDEALEATRKSKAILLIARLDRLSHDVRFVASLLDSGVRFVACDQPFASPHTLDS